MFQSTSRAVDLEICIYIIRLLERNMVKAVFALDQLVQNNNYVEHNGNWKSSNEDYCFFLLHQTLEYKRKDFPNHSRQLWETIFCLDNLWII